MPHVEEMQHGLTLMRWVCAKHMLDHHMASGMVGDNNVDTSDLLLGLISSTVVPTAKPLPSLVYPCSLNVLPVIES